MRWFWQQNWFVCVLSLALLLGYLQPRIGNSISLRIPVNVPLTLLIFFCIGLTLPYETLWSSLANWKFHLALQGFIFLVYPLIFVLLLFPFRHSINFKILLGFSVLAVLPTTVSSCVVFCKESGGNAGLSVVNAVLANLLGVFLTPLLIALISIYVFPFSGVSGSSLTTAELGRVAEGEEPAVSAFRIFYALSWKVFLPMLLGYLGRCSARIIVLHCQKQISNVNQLCIILIVFFSFSQAAAQEFFIQTLYSSPLPFVFLVLFQPLILVMAELVARLQKFDRMQRIAFVFTSSQKTITLGIPLINSIFGDSAGLGLVLFPLLFYHPWQLLVASFARLCYAHVTVRRK